MIRSCLSCAWKWSTFFSEQFLWFIGQTAHFQAWTLLFRQKNLPPFSTTTKNKQKKPNKAKQQQHIQETKVSEQQIIEDVPCLSQLFSCFENDLFDASQAFMSFQGENFLRNMFAPLVRQLISVFLCRETFGVCRWILRASKAWTIVVCEWPCCGMSSEKKQIVWIQFYLIEKVLLQSILVGLLLQAAKSLEPMVENAKSYIPASHWDTTPIALKATAGLRLLPAQQADAILREVCDLRLSNLFPGRKR